MPDPGALILRLATPADDADLRRLLQATPMPGAVHLRYEREPNFFAGCSVMGPFWQVITARTADGALVGFATRAVRRRYVNGEACDVGYLGQLRVDPRFRGNRISARAFGMLRELHADGRAPYYLATIVADNTPALRLLVERPEPDAPCFSPGDGLVTMAFPAALGAPTPPRGIELHWNAAERLAEVAAFLARYAPQRQFAPVYAATDLQGSPLTRGLHPGDLCLAVRNDAIVGVLGLWDQAGYKQTIVHAYAGWLKRVRPLYNLAAHTRGRRPLPPPGQPLHTLYACPLCIADDDPAVFNTLLRAALHATACRGGAYLALGLVERDPLLPIARRHAHLAYHSRIYLVSWEKELPPHATIDRRVPYLDLPAL